MSALHDLSFYEIQLPYIQNQFLFIISYSLDFVDLLSNYTSSLVKNSVISPFLELDVRSFVPSTRTLWYDALSIVMILFEAKLALIVFQSTVRVFYYSFLYDNLVRLYSYP